MTSDHTFTYRAASPAAGRTLKLVAMLLVAIAVHTPPAAAQTGARSQNIDTSIRAAGMGGAGAAVWWGEPGVWGNPATLANQQGITWVEGRTQLVPDLASDVWFKSQRYLLGGAGVGVSLMGDPIEGLGRTRLDYGKSQWTDPIGNPAGLFTPHETIEAWGIAVAPLQLFEALQRLRGGSVAESPLPVDVALGLQRKHTRVELAPAWAGGVGVAEADCVDWGVSGRLALLQLIAPEAPVEFDVSGGFAVLNANDANFRFLNETVANPPSRIRRIGLGVRMAVPLPGRDPDASTPFGWWSDAFADAVEFGLAVDSEHITAGGLGAGYDVQRFGLELTLLGMLTGRVGHVSNRTEDIVDNTHGFGVRLPLGPWASVGYDRASIPQPSGMEDVKRQGWSVWVDPVRIWTRH